MMQTANYLLVLSFSIAIGIPQVVAQVSPFPQPAPLPETTIAIPGLQPQVAKNLADGAVGLAATRLSLNLSDTTGVRLLQFAAAMDSRNPNFLYLNSVVKLGQEINPSAIPVKVTDAQYIAYLLNLAKAQKPSYFKLLLYNVVGLLDPAQRTAVIEVHRARENGLVADFDGVVQRLANTFPPTPPLAETSSPRLQGETSGRWGHQVGPTQIFRRRAPKRCWSQLDAICLGH
ncbi:MAG: hypothetical protein AAEJ57_06225 [Opitutales bacterium]